MNPIIRSVIGHTISLQYSSLYLVIFLQVTMKKQTHSILALALVFGLIFHGTSIFFTLESTYDALVHLFFAEHYSKDWFEPWDYRWYTGFTVHGYPPLVHQSMALLSYIGGLKFGLFSMSLIIISLFITGTYRFAYVITGSKKIAGYTALLGVFSSMFLETLHLFGQLPSLMGISVLMHAMPEIYNWIKLGKVRFLISSFSLIALTVTSHHVTPIFGMVFFIFPLIGMVIMDAAKDRVKQNQKVTFKVFLKELFKHLKRIITFGAGSLFPHRFYRHSRSHRFSYRFQNHSFPLWSEFGVSLFH
ncbi:hypothetical protein VC82_204 [Flagellimonas lutaonensis]|uniref:Integral membrane protein n=1 Tax=Flagellimonas lutaonensis TaxID=516051 RepID=A0A0D5YNT8_9FLAO|nr:hypothetical protein VC82_204 [Allomuricauda lutaonensis]